MAESPFVQKTHSDLLSPNIEIFSTPPTTPNALMDSEEIRPSLSRRGSRPTSLTLAYSQAEWNPDIELEENSPVASRKAQIAGTAPATTMATGGLSPRSSSATPSSNLNLEALKPSNDFHQPMASPCFVHSQLDKGASLSDWLRKKHKQTIDNGDVGVAKSLQKVNGGARESVPDVAADDDEDYGGSLTKQLAETAVSVREMSKQLG